MMVPRAFKYSTPPKDSTFDEKMSRRTGRVPVLPVPEKKVLVVRPRSPPRMNTEPVAIPSVKQPHFPVPERRASASRVIPTMPQFKSATMGRTRRKQSAHDPNALPPAVAALLAVTAIPPRRLARHRSMLNSVERMSIDQLVSQWKSEDLLKQSLSCSPALSLLLEDSDMSDGVDYLKKGSAQEDSYLNARSDSTEEVPELEFDDRSVLSVGSPSTPGSLCSRKSSTNLKKEKARSLPATEICLGDHPLVHRPDADDADELLLPLQKVIPTLSKAKSSFTSNLTTSLQSLKNAAFNSISSLGRGSNTSASVQRRAAPQMDDVLWSHPYLFPHFSSEVRPATDTHTTEAQRRYLNPMPLSFEEQEAPFQQALHAPYLAEATEHASTIQMQTYRGRNRRRSSQRRAGPDPKSEAGRALFGAEGVRQREVRENSDFLRVVVLEMNMRRGGKLETGRAKIWLPPREGSVLPVQAGRVPPRWRGESAY